LLILLFSLQLGWLPPSGREAALLDGGAGLRFLLMPMVCLASQGCAIISRFVRTSMIEVLSADYVRTARAKGLRERSVLIRHALRTSLIPVVTVVGIHFGRVLGGAVVVESVFSWPGLGRLVVYSILNKDFPVVQGVLILIVGIFLLVMLCVDVLYAYLDPRIKLEGSRR
jgi:ABC-type dipeptide/oligopeptide/nickel transport system permease component